MLVALALVLLQAACDKPERPAPAPPWTELSSGPPAADVDILFVYVGGDGVTIMHGKPFLIDAEIRAQAEAFHAKSPNGRVLVQSHEAAVHGRTVRVLDLLKEAEIRHIAVGVRRSS